MHGLITILIIVTTIIIIVQCWLGREARRGSLTKFASRFARSVSLRYLFITSISTNGKVGSRNIGLRRYHHLIISINININILIRQWRQVLMAQRRTLLWAIRTNMNAMCVVLLLRLMWREAKRLPATAADCRGRPWIGAWDWGRGLAAWAGAWAGPSARGLGWGLGLGPALRLGPCHLGGVLSCVRPKPAPSKPRLKRKKNCNAKKTAMQKKLQCKKTAWS